jgi:Pyruvate phosphate dikinase, AMP/ATP-binding domain
VGGKKAALGEMVRNHTSAGVRVPGRFATTADAYRQFVSDSGLAEMINAELADLDTDNVTGSGRSRIREAVIKQVLDSCIPARPHPSGLILSGCTQILPAVHGRHPGYSVNIPRSVRCRRVRVGGWTT